MATYTQNINLKMPEGTERVSRTDLNENLRKIDGVISEKLNRPLYNSDGTSGQVLYSEGGGNTRWGSVASEEQISSAVTSWLNENVPTGTTVVIDKNLTLDNAAAGAKATGDALAAVRNDIAPRYSSARAYAVGDYCMQEGQTYRCIVPIESAENFTASHWVAVDIANDLSGSVDDLKSALVEITGNEKIIFTTKKFIALNGTTANVNNMQTPSGNCNCAVVPCSEGDKFTVYATGGNAARAWGFVAEDGTVLSVAGINVSVNGNVLTAPANAVYLVINDNSAPPSYSYIGDGVLVNKVNKIQSTLESYDIQSTNRFNKNASDNENGVYLNTNTGATSTLSNYTTSGYIDVGGVTSLVLCYVHIYCFYAIDGSFISGGSYSSFAAYDYKVNVPQNAKYIRVSFPTANANTVQVGTTVTRDAYVAYDAKYTFDKLSIKPKSIVVAIDGSGDYTSFTEAIYNTWDSGIDVVVKPGIYDIKAEYIALFGQTVVDDMADSTDLNGFQFGVRLHNRKLKFESGSHLVCDWSTQTVSGSRRFSAIRVDANVTIEGMDLEVTGAFYAVHDDYGPNAIPFTNIYRNCRIAGHNLYNANCIGGGCKRYSKHILENCYFDNGQTNVTTVRYHNYALNQVAEPVIWVSNCYFNSLFTPRWAGTQTTKMTVFVNNCYAEAIYKLAEGTSENDNVVLVKWNNTETNPHD